MTEAKKMVVVDIDTHTAVKKAAAEKRMSMKAYLRFIYVEKPAIDRIVREDAELGLLGDVFHKQINTTTTNNCEEEEKQ